MPLAQLVKLLEKITAMDGKYVDSAKLELLLAASHKSKKELDHERLVAFLKQTLAYQYAKHAREIAVCLEKLNEANIQLKVEMLDAIFECAGEKNFIEELATMTKKKIPELVRLFLMQFHKKVQIERLRCFLDCYH